MKIILTILFVAQTVFAQEKWFDSLKGVKIENYEQFKTEVNKPELQNAHIMIEFYMEQCRFCVGFKDTWNQVHDEMSKKFNLKDSDQK